MPYASFVIPVKNGEKFLRKTIESLQQQTISDIEIIIVDDHSEDRTAIIADDIAGKDGRVKYFSNIGSGVPAARNFGTKNASGEVIFPTDADDPNRSNRVAITKSLLDQTGADIFYGNIERLWVETGKEELRHFQPYDAELFRCINFIGHPASAFKKEVFETVGGYDETLKIVEDYDFFLKAQESGFKFCCKNVVVAQYTMHVGQISGSSTKDKISERQRWNRVLRTKHKIYNVDADYVRSHASPDVVDFYINKNYEIWFSSKSLPTRG